MDTGSGDDVRDMTIKAITGDAEVKKLVTSQSADDSTAANSAPHSNGDVTVTSQRVKPDIDSRWSWVILVATFCNYIVVSAIWYSFSVLYKEFADHFDASLASIGVLASVEAAALHFTGALCSGMVERYGSRPVAMVGSAIAAAALFGGAFVDNLTILYIIYGLAGGGIGLSYVSFVVIIQLYFDKRRTIASGFSLTGFSLASFSLPPFTRWLLDMYGWRGTLMLISGFYLNGIVLAALLRPPPKPPVSKTRMRHRTASLSQRFSRQMSLERTKSRMHTCCELLRRIFDYRMFRNPCFVLYGLGTFFMMVGNIAFFMHLVNRAQFLGIEKHLATFLPSIYGIANGVCRLVFSVVASLPKCNRTVQYGAWIVAGGLVSCLSGLATDFLGLAVVCASFGMCVGAFICIQYPALVDLLGVKNIARSTGLLQIFIGAAGLIATPLAGWLYDVTDNYEIPYYVMGSVMILGGAIVLIIPCLQSRDQHAQQNGHHGSHKTSDLEASKDSVVIETVEAGHEETPSCQDRIRTLSSSSHLAART